MVAAHPVDTPAGGVTHDSLVKSGAANTLPQLGFQVEGFLAVAVGHQFEPDEKAAAADVADVRVLAEALLQSAKQQSAQMPHAREQPIALDRLLHTEGGGDGDGVAGVSVPVL